MAEAEQLQAEALGMIGESPPMVELIRQLRRVAPTQATVLILGESGTGKELVAAAIHRLSERVSLPFVTVDCTNIPGSLMESELFGHEAGAFTDARTSKQGVIEVAHGGTCFLDEISLLPLELQAKLLHVLETQRFRRLGATEEITVDVRFLAATNEDLARAVDEGRFREDLYHRLNVVPVRLPPLRERGHDVRRIAEHVVAHYSERHQSGARRLGASAELLLDAYDWPGNVRELRNVIERAVLMSDREVIRADDLIIDRRSYRQSSDLAVEVSGSESADVSVALPPDGVSLEAVEKALIVAALGRTSGNVSQAAQLLRISRDKLRYRMEKHGLRV